MDRVVEGVVHLIEVNRLVFLAFLCLHNEWPPFFFDTGRASSHFVGERHKNFFLHYLPTFPVGFFIFLFNFYIQRYLCLTTLPHFSLAKEYNSRLSLPNLLLNGDCLMGKVCVFDCIT